MCIVPDASLTSNRAVEIGGTRKNQVCLQSLSPYSPDDPFHLLEHVKVVAPEFMHTLPAVLIFLFMLCASF